MLFIASSTSISHRTTVLSPRLSPLALSEVRVFSVSCLTVLNSSSLWGVVISQLFQGPRTILLISMRGMFLLPSRLRFLTSPVEVWRLLLFLVLCLVSTSH